MLFCMCEGVRAVMRENHRLEGGLLTSCIYFFDCQAIEVLEQLEGRRGAVCEKQSKCQ